MKEDEFIEMHRKEGAGMNLDLSFLLHYEQRELLCFSDELTGFKRLLRRLGFKCKLKKSSWFQGGYNMGRSEYDYFVHQGKIEVYLDEQNKLQPQSPLTLEENIIKTLTHEYLHIAFGECVGKHEEDWVVALTEEVL